MSVLNKKQNVNFWNKVDKSGVCWKWTAAKTSFGYGVFWHNGRHELTHRLSYMIKKGDIPEGLEIDHLCRNKICINPDHLEAVSHMVNIQRSKCLITHCPKGHEYTNDNLVKRKNIGGHGRECKKCSAIRAKKKRGVKN